MKICLLQCNLRLIIKKNQQQEMCRSLLLLCVYVYKSSEKVPISMISYVENPGKTLPQDNKPDTKQNHHSLFNLIFFFFSEKSGAT